MKEFVFPGKNFDIKETFDCGQCFRWEEKDGKFFGVAGGYWGEFSHDGENVRLKTNSPDESFWVKYLDLERDYGEIINKVRINPLMEKAVKNGEGIRLLKQEFFETLMSFIISQRSSIPKIKSVVAKICENWGEERCADEVVYYTFPSPEELRDVTEEDFRKIGTGYRAPYLVRAVKAVLEGEISEEELVSLETGKARERLISLYGVGDKVCDCVMLFSLAKYDLFPSDVWIKRVMCENFGSSEKSAKEDGERLFGEYSGFAQQYLFYYRRNLE